MTSDLDIHFLEVRYRCNAARDLLDGRQGRDKFSLRFGELALQEALALFELAKARAEFSRAGVRNDVDDVRRLAFQLAKLFRELGAPVGLRCSQGPEFLFNDGSNLIHALAESCARWVRTCDGYAPRPQRKSRRNRPGTASADGLLGTCTVRAQGVIKSLVGAVTTCFVAMNETLMTVMRPATSPALMALADASRTRASLIAENVAAPAAHLRDDGTTASQRGQRKGDRAARS